MIKKRLVIPWGWLVSGLLYQIPASGADLRQCQTLITAQNVAQCALASNPSLQAEAAALQAKEGGRINAQRYFPSNPTLNISAARRGAKGMEPEAFNWYLTLGEEIEVGGQRGARKKAAEATWEAQKKRIQGVAREIAKEAWVAFYETLAFEETHALARELETISNRAKEAVHAMAERGRLSPLETHLTDIAATRMFQFVRASERKYYTSRAVLGTLVGVDAQNAAWKIEGTLDPSSFPIPLAPPKDQMAQEDLTSPEIESLQAEEQSLQTTAVLLRRTRIPNPTFFFFAQNDGYNEKVLGGGVSIPIPLPEPIGQTYNGNIQEMEASAQRLAFSRQQAQRTLRQQRRVIWHKVESTRLELQAFSTSKIQQVKEDLQKLAQEIETGHIGIRDALFMQESMIQFFVDHIEAKRLACIAAVEWAHASGAPLEASL
ncbi:TolC family protein [Pajaroellobacter abortibovis]|nr:TolC family protein [Pajaroellobacter abortibovis]